MNGSKLSKLVRIEPVRKELDGRRPSKKRKKKKEEKKGTHRREKGALTWEKAVILSSKRNKTTKKNSWVNKDLTKSPKWKCFEEKEAVQNAIKNRTTKNWVEEDLSKFPMKKRKTLERQSKCHVFVKQVCFSYGESPRTPPLEGTSLHRRNISVERPWGILSLFATCLPLWVNSSRLESLSHVTYTGIDGMHSQRTKQPWIQSARKNRTRKKSMVEEDQRKSPEMNNKKEPFE